MNPTQDPQTDASFFTACAEDWFLNNKTPKFATTHEAIGLIQAADPLVDIYQRQLEEAGATYSDRLILEFGSALGEAFRLLFIGEWKYSASQERWVISFTTPQGSTSEINIFYKLQKRFDNGMVDSVGFLFEGVRKMYLEEAQAAGLSD